MEKRKTIIEMGEAWAKAMASFFSGVNAAIAQRNEEVRRKAFNAARASGDEMDAILHAAVKRAEESAETVSEALDRLSEKAVRGSEYAASFRKIYREKMCIRDRSWSACRRSRRRGIPGSVRPGS